jgi:pyruvate/2-oxoglutarate/acetoin dehydrogenase E1 component
VNGDSSYGDKMAMTSYVQAINEALREEMERDPLTFVMGEDVVLSAFGATKGLVDKFGLERVRNTPIAEAGFVGAAVGAAMAGTRPICEVEFASFFYCAFDQVCNQAAKLRYMSGGQAKLPITFRCVYGAMGGAAAQHSETVYAQFLSAPGLKIAVPSSPADVKGLLKTAIRDDNPVIVFEHGSLGRHREEIPAGEHLVPLGKAAIKRPGDNVTVVAIGAMVPKALKVAEKLAKENISIEVIDPRTLIPLDEEAILSSVEKTHPAIVVDEGHLRGGAATDIAAMISEKGFDFLDGPVRRVTSLDVPIPFSPPLEKAAIADEARLETAIRQTLGA